MNKAVLLILVGTLAVLTNGCSYISEFTKARKEIEEQEVEPISVQVQTAGEQKETESNSEVFADLSEPEEPEESEESEAVEPAPEAGLIAATDPDVRARLADRGRNDPFAVIPIPSTIEVEPEEEEPVAINRNNRNRNNRPEPTPAPIEEPTRRNSEPFFPELPPPPDPTLAQNVQILGLYEAPNGSTKLIVQAPEESNSRYVEVGQYLSNGEVLVKSIDRGHSPYPQVVLEQSGVEVYKAIGEDPDEMSDDLS